MGSTTTAPAAPKTPARPRSGGPSGSPVGDEPLLLPGMPEPLVAATPTRLSGWVSCPRRYRFTYLERPTPRRGAPWARSAVGAAVHTALARWWQAPTSARTPARAASLLVGAWQSDGFRDRRQEHAARARTIDMVARYAGTLDPEAAPVGVERTVAARTSTLSLSGRVDRIDERPVERLGGPVPTGAAAAGTTELVIVDYKTGRLPAPAAPGESLALAVYALGAARLLRRACRRVELHHLPSGSVLVHDHTPESLRAHADRADTIGLELRAAHTRWAGGLTPAEVDRVFPARPGPGCGWCDFRISCPEGAAASSALPPWAGLDDSAPAD